MTFNLPVVETFHSIQGEGYHVGKSAFFIRLAGCFVGCSWCDTKHSWDSSKYARQSVDELAKITLKATQKGVSFIVISGGEPLHHNLNPLCNAIRETMKPSGQNIIPIHIETSGVNELTGHPNWVTLSPKPHAPPRPEILESCNEIKVVIHSKEDITFAESIAKKITYIKQNQKENSELPNEQFLYLQPGWECMSGLNLVIEYIKYNPMWRLSLQTHKWLGIK